MATLPPNSGEPSSKPERGRSGSKTPETCIEYNILEAGVYERMLALMDMGRVDPSL
jgi:hypothetical protein